MGKMKMTICCLVMSVVVLSFVAILRPVMAKAPSPQGIVNQMLQRYRTLKSMEEVSTESTERRRGSSAKETMNLKARFVYERPNKFLCRVDDPEEGYLVVGDGKTVWLCVPQARQYMKRKEPASLTSLTKVLPEFTPSMDPLAFLMGKDPLKGSTGLKLVGAAKVQGKTAYHLRFNDARRDAYELWIGAQDSLLYKMKVTQTYQRRGTTFVRQMIETHSRIRINSGVSDSVFSFVPPKGARLVDKLQCGCG